VPPLPPFVLFFYYVKYNYGCFFYFSVAVVFVPDGIVDDAVYYLLQAFVVHLLSILLLPAFELFLCSRHVAAATSTDNDAVDYSIMLPVIMYLLLPMDQVCRFLTSRFSSSRLFANGWTKLIDWILLFFSFVCQSLSSVTTITSPTPCIL